MHIIDSNNYFDNLSIICSLWEETINVISYENSQ